MFTGAKLLAAVIYAATGALAALAAIPGLPEGRQPGQIVLISTLMGIFFGWSLIGKQVTESKLQAFLLSVRTIVMMVIATLFIISGFEAYERSIKLFYDGPVEAVTDIANLMVFFGKMGLQAPVVMILVLGMSVGAVFVHWAGRVWE